LEGHVRHFSRFLVDDAGATSIEYGMIAVLIAVVIVVAVSVVGSNTSELYQSVADGFPS
jgi:pilus assembly protein Flp/PilA